MKQFLLFLLVLTSGVAVLGRNDLKEGLNLMFKECISPTQPWKKGDTRAMAEVLICVYDALISINPRFGLNSFFKQMLILYVPIPAEFQPYGPTMDEDMEEMVKLCNKRIDHSRRTFMEFIDCVALFGMEIEPPYA